MRRTNWFGPSIAQQLGDRVAEQRPVIDWSNRPLVGEVEQRPHAVADEAGGRFVPGDVERDDLRDQLLVGEGLAVFLGVDEPGQDVVVVPPALVVDELVEERIMSSISARSRSRSSGVHDGVERAGDAVHPVAEDGVVLLGDAEHLAEDLDRQRVGEVLDEVELDWRAVPCSATRASTRAATRSSDELAGIASIFAGPERLGDQLAEAGRGRGRRAARAVRPPVRLVATLDLGERERGGVGVVDLDGDGRVAQERVDVGEAGDDPAVEQFGAVDRVVARGAAGTGRRASRRSHRRAG